MHRLGSGSARPVNDAVIAARPERLIKVSDLAAIINGLKER